MEDIVVHIRAKGDREDVLDQLDYSRITRRRTRRMTVIFGGAILAMFLASLALDGVDLLRDPFVWGYLIFFAILAAWSEMSVLRAARERARTWSERWSTPAYRFDSGGVAVEDEGMSMRFPWSHVTNIEETERLVIVHVRQDFTIWLPRRVVDVSTLRALRAASAAR